MPGGDGSRSPATISTSNRKQKNMSGNVDTEVGAKPAMEAQHYRNEGIKMRMKNPAVLIPAAMVAIKGMAAAAREGGIDEVTPGLAHLRVSQVNGCGVCVDSGTRYLRRTEQSDERVSGVAAWRDTPYFTDAERAALALAEAATRLSDRPDPVPDSVWEEATRHFDEKQLASILLEIATTNVYNRLNVATRQVAGAWGGW
jgi:AhpD family alkylhydroperoxidase